MSTTASLCIRIPWYQIFLLTGVHPCPGMEQMPDELQMAVKVQKPTVEVQRPIEAQLQPSSEDVTFLFSSTIGAVLMDSAKVGHVEKLDIGFGFLTTCYCAVDSLQ